MKAAVIRKFEKPQEAIQIVNDWPVPQLTAADEVLVKVYATSVNPVDWKMLLSRWSMLRLPRVPLEDVAGVVTKVGVNCHRLKVGDHVFGMQDPRLGGCAAEYVVMKENLLVKKPDNISFNDAAGVPLVALTAFQALHDKANITPTDRIFINGGSTAVGLMAIQIAKSHGCHVVATCSTRNIDLVNSIGADLVIDYTKIKPAHELKGQYFDVFIDCVGDAWSDALQILRKSQASRYVAIGLGHNASQWDKAWKAIGSVTTTALRTVSGKIWSYFGYPQYSFMLTTPGEQTMSKIASLITESKLRPVTDRTYNLEELAEALSYSMSGKARGKIVIQVFSEHEAR